MSRGLSFTISKTEWLTVNGRYHHMDRAKRTHTLRHKAYISALQALQSGDSPIMIAYPTRDTGRL